MIPAASNEIDPTRSEAEAIEWSQRIEAAQARARKARRDVFAAITSAGWSAEQIAALPPDLWPIEVRTAIEIADGVNRQTLSLIRGESNTPPAANRSTPGVPPGVRPGAPTRRADKPRPNAPAREGSE